MLPPWVTPKRVAIALAAAVLIGVGQYGVRLALALAHASHDNPFSAVANALSGGNGSSIDRARQNLQRINIMIYGYGGDGHDGAYLSDSIMMVSIQPQQNGPPQVAEISIPRDWYVPNQLANGKVDYGRINQAYSDGMSGEGTAPQGSVNAGASVGNATMTHVLGVNIDHFAGVDFAAFKAAVDAVGGVNVNVPTAFTDTQYPHGECDQGDCAYMTVHFNAGPQHMDGTTALEFARSRHGDNGEGSDFARSRRQQLILAALKQKAVSVGGIGNLPGLISSLGDNVLTDLSIGDMEALYSLVKNVDSKKVEHVSLDDTNFLYECGYPQDCGAAYLYAHDRSYQAVTHFVQNVFPNPKALAENAPVTFYDASGRGIGASARWATTMGMLGFGTTDGGTVARQAVTQVIDYSGGKDTNTAQWLASYFGVTVTTPTPAPVAPGTSAAPSPGGVQVILGTAEETAFLGDPGVGK
ncbi:MAG: LCP family protein [Candidatus Dormibacteraeota bacterium]|nr:LCP family protein [Candidatus Dormibacteraeota bacterium]